MKHLYKTSSPTFKRPGQGQRRDIMVTRRSDFRVVIKEDVRYKCDFRLCKQSISYVCSCSIASIEAAELRLLDRELRPTCKYPQKFFARPAFAGVTKTTQNWESLFQNGVQHIQCQKVPFLKTTSFIDMNFTAFEELLTLQISLSWIEHECRQEIEHNLLTCYDALTLSFLNYLGVSIDLLIIMKCTKCLWLINYYLT